MLEHAGAEFAVLDHEEPGLLFLCQKGLGGALQGAREREHALAQHDADTQQGDIQGLQVFGLRVDVDAGVAVGMGAKRATGFLFVRGHAKAMFANE